MGNTGGVLRGRATACDPATGWVVQRKDGQRGAIRSLVCPRRPVWARQAPVALAGGPFRWDPERPPLPREVRGQHTGQGMEPQGQMGRGPSAHEPPATRRLQRDAVVFEDYTTHEGIVIPQGAIRAHYAPETCPELPQKLARLSRGDTAAALAFVRTYGLLGYAPLAAAVGRRNHRHAPGDPLAWIWAQAETVALCLLLTYGLKTGDDTTLQHGLRAVQLPQPDGGPRLIVPAVWDQPRVHVDWPSPLHTPEDWRTYARSIRREVLNAHLMGIHNEPLLWAEDRVGTARRFSPMYQAFTLLQTAIN